MRRPSVRSAASRSLDHGLEQLRRTKFRKRPVALKIGPGAMLIFRSSAASYSRIASHFPGSSTQTTNPPAGLVTRVPGGK